MGPQFLTPQQCHGLVCYQGELKQAAALLRSVAPDQWQVAWRLDRLANRVAEGNGRMILKEDAVNTLAGVQRVGPLLGSNAQECLQGWIEPLVHRMGLVADVAVATEPPQIGVQR